MVEAPDPFTNYQMKAPKYSPPPAPIKPSDSDEEFKALTDEILAHAKSELKKLISESKDTHDKMGNAAEIQLFKKIINGDLAAIQFYLKTKHKTRGYVEKMDNTNITISLHSLVEASMKPATIDGEVVNVISGG